MDYGRDELTLNATIVQRVLSLRLGVNRAGRLCVVLVNDTHLEPIPERLFHPLRLRR